MVWILDFHANIDQNRGLLVKTYTGMYLFSPKTVFHSRWQIVFGYNEHTTFALETVTVLPDLYTVEGASIVVLVHISIYTTAAQQRPTRTVHMPV